jgi:orotidine-5'-phosphate decarboxylase
MMNVHASGGSAMLDAARDAIPAANDAPKLIAVTLLTSLAAADLVDVGLTGTPDDAVLRLATLAKMCALDGVVCSAHEVSLLRATCGPGFTLVTPGIRPAAASADDQQRVMTPAVAIANGATYLVIGRPITRAADPLQSLAAINREIADTMRAP